MNAYLAINNTIMKNFLIQSGLFEFPENLDTYDILICDTLDLGKSINANKKIYLACNYFEQLDNLSAYSGYDYFMGFSDSNIYFILKEKFGLEPSKIINGFVNIGEIDYDIAENDNVLLSCINNDRPEDLDNKINEIVSRFYNIFTKSIFSVFHNHSFGSNYFSKIDPNNFTWTDDFSINLLENSLIIVTESLLNCRLFFNEDCINKTLLLTRNFSNIRKYIESDKNIINMTRYPISILEKIENYQGLYNKLFDKKPYSDFGFYEYCKSKIIENKRSIELDKSNENIFLNYIIDNEGLSTNNMLLDINNINDSILLYKIINGYTELRNKEKRIMKIKDCSSEFLDILKGII